MQSEHYQLFADKDKYKLVTNRGRKVKEGAAEEEIIEFMKNRKQNEYQLGDDATNHPRLVAALITGIILENAAPAKIQFPSICPRCYEFFTVAMERGTGKSRGRCRCGWEVEGVADDRELIETVYG